MFLPCNIYNILLYSMVYIYIYIYIDIYIAFNANYITVYWIVCVCAYIYI